MLAKAQKAFKSAAPGANLDGALDMAKRALKEEECCEVHVLIGAIFTAQDEHEMAEGAFERALSLDEESAQAWKGLAALLEAQGRERRADLLQPYEKVVALLRADPESKGAAKWAKKLDELRGELGLGDGKPAAEKSPAAKPKKEPSAESPSKPSAERGSKAAKAKAAAAAAAAAAAGGGERRSNGADADGDGEGGGGDSLAKQKEQLAALRAKAAAGEKLSGKQKRELKKLEDAEARWKEYEQASGAADGGGGGGGAAAPDAIGAQFSAESSTAGATAASGMGGAGGGIEVPAFSIRANATELFVDARLSLRAGRRYGLVGPNGKGKTTLLKHIAARKLHGIPQQLHVLYVEQEVRATEASVIATLLDADTQRAALVAAEASLGRGWRRRRGGGGGGRRARRARAAEAAAARGGRGVGAAGRGLRLTRGARRRGGGGARALDPRGPRLQHGAAGGGGVDAERGLADAPRARARATSNPSCCSSTSRRTTSTSTR